jgi:7-carboxy-7-deazaguanine synthase
MNISEIFYSIQGEGKRSGFPSFFIRTNFCNLRCQFPHGLCDTPYTSWRPYDKKNKGKMETEKLIEEYKKYNSTDVVITGGEPAIQKAELAELCRELKNLNKNIFITLETNGTIFDSFADYIDLVSISPKLKSSIPYGTKFEDMHNNARYNFDALQKFIVYQNEGKTDIQWKFVFSGEEDMSEILDLQDVLGIKNSDIFLMPEGNTKSAVAETRKAAVEAALRHNFNYTERLQILLWGNQRGK